ncbi:hypothetical protein EWM64_g9303 [Hericium alpestre]|uniref:Uncharacterized protein n=1 Tax=Hericium alpestre TaxID=135208 RepID=A0A4Y9ZMP5_9AGAM|nr:hypothetical protein EWM64_g9303 [Hericium alpestre]
MDVSTLIYHMGGHALLYAMSQCSGISSLCTLRNHTVFTRVMPTVGHIMQKEIDHNIREVIVKALEDKDMTSSQSAVNIAQGLANGSVHMGKEMTITSLSFFGLDGTFPVLAAPTCKQETAEDMQFILELILKTWKDSPGIKYSTIWSVATDGDSMRHACSFNMFLKHRLLMASPLYGTLSNMPGLNLYTGDDKITLDFDYKHIFKCICTLIRSPNGIMLNGGRTVTSAILECYLIMFKGETVETVKRLLNPEDLQDVPRAIELMQMVISLGTCNVEMNHPSIVADMDAIRYLAALLEAILEPFININLSLQEQII